MDQPEPDARIVALNEVGSILKGILQRYIHHSNTMDAMYSKDGINGSIQAVETAIRAVNKLK